MPHMQSQQVLISVIKTSIVESKNLIFQLDYLKISSLMSPYNPTEWRKQNNVTSYKQKD